jgi:hypothetical protein
MLFSVGYMLPYDRPGAIFSLSQVQHFLGDEGNYRTPIQTPQTEGAHPPSGNPLMYLFNGGQRRKNDHFFINYQTKTCVLGPNMTFFQYLRPKRGEGVKSALFRVY